MNLFYTDINYMAWALSVKTILNKKFAQLASLDFMEKGKNKTTTFVQSFSKRNQAQKQWVRKDLCSAYDIEDAASEIFFGQLAANVFGKDSAPKTKFNPDRPGIISRILGDNLQKTTKLLTFVIEENTTFSMAAKKSLLNSLAFGVIIGDRDIAARNMIVNREPGAKTAQHVYGIDHEFGVLKLAGLATLGSFVRNAISEPLAIFDIVVTNKYKWSHGSAFAHVPKEYTEPLLNKMCEGISADDVKLSFRSIAENIAANDFQLCADIKQQMLKQLHNAANVYPPHIVNTYIIPKIDLITTALRENVLQVLNITEEMKLPKPATPVMAVTAKPENVNSESLNPESLNPETNLLYNKPGSLAHLFANLILNSIIIFMVMNFNLVFGLLCIMAAGTIIKLIANTTQYLLDSIYNSILLIANSAQTAVAFVVKVCRAIHDEIIAAVQGILALVTDTYQAIKGAVVATGRAIYGVVHKTYETTRDAVLSVVNASVNLVQNTVKTVKDTAVAIVNEVVATVNDVAFVAQLAYKSTKDFVVTSATSAIDYVQQKYHSAKDYIVSAVGDNASYVQQTCQATVSNAAVSMQDNVYYLKETCKSSINEATITVGEKILDMQDACQAGLSKVAATGYSAINYLQQMYNAKSGAVNQASNCAATNQTAATYAKAVNVM